MSEKKTYENDYSLLRAFDLEAAKAGAGLIFTGDWIGESACVFVGNHGNETCVHFEKFGYAIFKSDDGVCDVSELRMAPLRWVEGKPVYPGDELFYREGYEQGRFIAKRAHADESRVYGFTYFDNGRTYEDERSCEYIAALTWEKPNSVLCEVEGKPVRKGDRLYGKWEGSRPDGYEIAGLDHLGRLVSTFGLALADDHGRLTWDKPKPKQDDGWITWNGGECPVPEGTLVEVRLRDGSQSVEKAWIFRWPHAGDKGCSQFAVEEGDIVAYRVVEQPKPESKGRKLWVNVYATSYWLSRLDLSAHETKELADKWANSSRLACIEIELPPLAEVAK